MQLTTTDIGIHLFETLANQYKNIIIYGAGAVSKIIIPYIRLAYSNVSIEGIAVSRDSDSYDSVNGIPVKTIKEYEKFASDTVILVATSDRYHNEIADILNEEGFKNVVLLSNDMKDAIVEKACKIIFEKYNIDLRCEYIKIGDVRIVNPRDLHIDNSTNILSQIADLIMPPVLDDWSLLAEGPYEYGEVYLQPDDTVFDCGANMGVFSAYASSKGCRVYAFEPTETLIPVIRKQADLNGGEIIPIMSAVSDNSGQARLVIDPYSCGGNSITATNNVGGSRYVDVPCVTLDNFVQENCLDKVNFIKADIEGAERLMLKGAKETLRRFAPKISICTYHLPDDKQVLEALIREANPEYNIIHKWQKLYAWV